MKASSHRRIRKVQTEEPRRKPVQGRSGTTTVELSCNSLTFVNFLRRNDVAKNFDKVREGVAPNLSKFSHPSPRHNPIKQTQ